MCIGSILFHLLIVKLLGLDLDLAPTKFSLSQIWYHGNLNFDKYLFVYNLMDLYIIIKFSLFTTMVISCAINRTNN